MTEVVTLKSANFVINGTIVLDTNTGHKYRLLTDELFDDLLMIREWYMDQVHGKEPSAA